MVRSAVSRRPDAHPALIPVAHHLLMVQYAMLMWAVAVTDTVSQLMAHVAHPPRHRSTIQYLTLTWTIALTITRNIVDDFIAYLPRQLSTTYLIFQLIVLTRP
jgi:uncharacterized membrane protein AbrB (regulator of aidB expression)